jgi:hypothetical protein
VPGALFGTGKGRGGAKSRGAGALDRRTGSRCEIVELFAAFHFDRILTESARFVNEGLQRAGGGIAH